MYDEEIEKAMLYYVIYEQYECDLDKDDFVGNRNVKIINAINELKAKKDEISILSIQREIKANKTEVLSYLTTLNEFVYGTNADTVYNKLIDLSKKRKIIKILQDNLIATEETDVDVLAENIISQINHIQARDDKQKDFSEQVAQTLGKIEDNYNQRNDYSLYTGIKDLDDKVLGLHNQEFTVLGARPGVGKTTMALQIAQNIATKGKKVLVISLEMSDTQIIQKLISTKSRVNSYRMRRGTLEDKDWDNICVSAGEISSLPITLVSNTNTIQKIESTIRKLKNRGKVDVVIIDYIQLIRNRNKFGSREQEVADITRTLKLLTTELDIPILGLCQLNRNATKQEPTLADLRESGSIEQDADNVWFLYQEQEQDANVVDVTLKVAKQRAGEVGKVYLKFNKPNSEFIGIMRY